MQNSTQLVCVKKAFNLMEKIYILKMDSETVHLQCIVQTIHVCVCVLA